MSTFKTPVTLGIARSDGDFEVFAAFNDLRDYMDDPAKYSEMVEIVLAFLQENCDPDIEVLERQDLLDIIEMDGEDAE